MFMGGYLGGYLGTHIVYPVIR